MQDTTTLKQFIKDNSKLIAYAVNKYTEACNIKFSEFSEDQQKRLQVSIATNELKKMLNA